MNKRIKTLSLLLALVVSNVALAIEAAAVPEKKRTEAGLYLTAVEAFELLGRNGTKALFLDIRTPAEVGFLGMPTLADANVPYMLMGEAPLWDEKKNGFKLTPNAVFADSVAERLSARGLTKEDVVILMCRSGSRSAKAANLLSRLGYKQVYTMVDGFEGDTAKEGPQKGQRVVNGWKNSGLAWSYALQKEKMYKISD